MSTVNREELMTGEQATEDAIRLTLTVSASVERAYAVFAEELASWYPSEYTWSQDVLETIGIEGREGKRCFERGPYGFWMDWGRVLLWDPPHRLVFSWQISPRREPVPDPEKSSEVELRFHEEGPRSTRVEFEHRGLSRHGEGAESYLKAISSEQGWPYILDRYAGAFG
ncbi:MAG: SRPBCC family protein [Actinomycetota bacterium]|nr:SRPBCC family protein [Actinomycetota bacterium]